MKFSLACCPAGALEHPPLPLAEAAGCLSYANHEVDAFDLNALWRREKGAPAWSACVPAYAAQLLAKKPDAAGFTMKAGSESASYELAAQLKKLAPSTPIVMMGTYFREESAVAEAFSRCPVDVVIAGAIDDVLPKLAGLFDATRRWQALPGVWLRQADGPKRGPKAVPFTFDLDLSPPADFSWVDASLYDRPDTMPLEGSRGCQSTCDFCAGRELWAKFSFKSGDRIFTDASRGLTQQRGWKRLDFQDIMANGNPDSLRRFAAMARAEGWPGRGVRWRIQAAVRPEMDAAYLEALAAGGCEEIVYGLETGSERLRAVMGKPFSNDLAVKVFTATRAAGVRCSVSLIAGHPDETGEDFTQTLAFLQSRRGAFDAVSARAAAVEVPSRLWRAGRSVDFERALLRLAELEAACAGAGATA